MRSQDEAIKNHPQNPYNSFLVQASAGSGKTYQLSKRYLSLVASGAAPSGILTITFTVKAASEMRARIISEAGSLLVNEKQQIEFDQQLNLFYQQALTAPEYKGKRIQPPLSGKDAATRVLANTQMLKIMTIDSLFKEWTSRFSFEAGADGKSIYQQQSAPNSRLMDTMEKQKLDEEVWRRLFVSAEAKPALDALWCELRKTGWEWTPLKLRGILEELFRLQTFIWYSGWKDQGQSPFRPHPVPAKTGVNLYLSAGEVIAHLKEPLTAISSVTSKSDLMAGAIAQGDLQKLIELRLLTKDLKIHGGTIRAKKREALLKPILDVEDFLRSWQNIKKLSGLNDLGQSFFRVYEAWMEEREKLKYAQERTEFNDLTIGSYQLFHQDKGAGAIWQIQQSIRHLMFDEFQDTSLTQWGVFEKLTRELLSGEGASERDGLQATVFIVGDYKQSIYGFREADPKVMDIAQDCLNEFNKIRLPLNKSYRTSPVILSFVNQLFADLMEGFPEHETATFTDQKPFIPNQGKVIVCDWIEGDGQKKAVEKEAEQIADFLVYVIEENPEEFPVYLKGKKAFRNPRYEDFCILYRNATHAHEFEKSLRLRNIPYVREEKKGFFERSEIQDMICMFRFLLDPTHYIAMLTLCQSPVFSGNGESLSKLISEVISDDISPEDKARLIYKKSMEFWTREHGIDFEQLRFLSRTMLPHQILARLYRDFEIPDRYELCYSGSEGLIARRNLIRLLEVCCTLEDEGYVSLNQCLQRLDMLSEFDEWSSASGDANVVNLMTIHKSKGLEFPFVLVIEAGEPWYRGDRYWVPVKGAKAGVSFSGSKSAQPSGDPMFDGLLKKQDQAHYEESLRLLYVALTRASQYLMISGHRPSRFREGTFLEKALRLMKESGAQTWNRPGAYVIESSVSDRMYIPETTGQGTHSDQPDVLDTQIKFTKFRTPVETDIISPHSGGDERLKNDREAGVISGAESRVVAMVMGTFIHRYLELYIQNEPWSPEKEWKKICDAQLMLNRDLYWRKNQQLIYKRCLSEAELVLSSDVWKTLFKNAIKCEAEKSFVFLKNQQLVRGQVDLSIQKDDCIVLVDYKTGYLPFGPSDGLNPQDIQQRLRSLCQENGYRFQMSLYASGFKLLYPGLRVYSYILFTKGCHLVEI